MWKFVHLLKSFKYVTKDNESARMGLKTIDTENGTIIVYDEMNVIWIANGLVHLKQFGDY